MRCFSGMQWVRATSLNFVQPRMNPENQNNDAITKARRMEARRIVYERVAEKPTTYAEKVKIPDLKDGEILGKILAATICGSDMHTLSGKRNEASPSVLGHEGIIEVVKSKREMTGLKEGDRATFHIADCCKDCTLCQSGLQQKCERLFKVENDSFSYQKFNIRELLFSLCDHVIDPESHTGKIAKWNKCGAPLQYLNCSNSYLFIVKQ